jgi:hypothetical protein
MWLYLVLGCTGDGAEDSGTEKVYAAPRLEAGLLVVDAMAGAVSGAVCGYGDQSGTTTESGEAMLRVDMESFFEIHVSSGEHRTHSLVGLAGEEDFNYRATLLSDSLLGQAYSLLGLQEDAASSILIVSLERGDLGPSMGSSAETSAVHGGAFVLGSIDFIETSEIQPNGRAFVVFPNAEPGIADIDVQAREGEECWLHPAGSSSAEVELRPGEVTVALFRCSG